MKTCPSDDLDEASALVDEAVEIVEPTDYLDMKGIAHEVRAGRKLAELDA